MSTDKDAAFRKGSVDLSRNKNHIYNSEEALGTICPILIGIAG